MATKLLIGCFARPHAGQGGGAGWAPGPLPMSHDHGDTPVSVAIVEPRFHGESFIPGTFCNWDRNILMGLDGGHFYKETVKDLGSPYNVGPLNQDEAYNSCVPENQPKITIQGNQNICFPVPGMSNPNTASGINGTIAQIICSDNAYSLFTNKMTPYDYNWPSCENWAESVTFEVTINLQFMPRIKMFIKTNTG